MENHLMLKIKCDNPSSIRKAIELDELKSKHETVDYKVEGEYLIVKIDATSFNVLQKALFSVSNRMKLALDTFKLCEAER